MNVIEGKILTETGFENGYILQKHNETPALHFGTTHVNSNKKYLLIPTFINAHTHIGDTFIRKKEISLPRNIVQLVAPPNGLKHTLLKQTDPRKIVQGMIHGLSELQMNGISTFVDFRENGLSGINQLKEALRIIPMNSLILGRPEIPHPSTQQLNGLLQRSDGIGMSSVKDCDYNDIAYIAEYSKKHSKLFALHASEDIREQIGPILKLHPNFIVHMTKATKKDLQQVKDESIPIVVCPRSNYFFSKKANLKRMKEIGNTILLGTDNFMFHPPSILREIQFIRSQFKDLFSFEELLIMSTYSARKALNLKDNIPGSTFPMSWIILNPNNYQITTVIKKVEEG